MDEFGELAINLLEHLIMLLMLVGQMLVLIQQLMRLLPMCHQSYKQIQMEHLLDEK